MPRAAPNAASVPPTTAHIPAPLGAPGRREQGAGLPGEARDYKSASSRRQQQQHRRNSESPGSPGFGSFGSEGVLRGRGLDAEKGVA